MLAVFLVYTSIAGGTPQLAPSELEGRTGQVTLVGKVVAPVQRSGRTIRFRIKDVEGGSSVRLPVTYTGSVPDMFRAGRDISLKGRLRNGIFVGASGTLVTKCPSKYSSKKET
jgi:cytochrome c-type biogenesis protein CcmE